MRTRLLAVLSVVLLAASAHASKHILPDACGADEVKFDVKTLKDQPLPAAPADGKAQIVFIESKAGPMLGSPTIRFGVDGAWVGAAKGNTYFVVNVAPGERHLCYSMKGSKTEVGATSITVEAGKVYYFEYKIVVTKDHSTVTVMGSAGTASGMANNIKTDTGFGQISDDEGKFHVKAYELATSTPDK